MSIYVFAAVLRHIFYQQLNVVHPNMRESKIKKSKISVFYVIFSIYRKWMVNISKQVCYIEKLFCEMLQNSHEKRFCFSKVADSQSVNFENVLRMAFLQNTEQLFLMSL